MDLEEAFMCLTDDACVLEVYTLPQEFTITEPEFQDEIHIDVNLEQSTRVDESAASRRVSAANQVLPLLTSVYEDRTSSEIAVTGLAVELCNALQPETTHSRTCFECSVTFLSSTRLLYHARQQHGLIHLTSLQQCYVCRQRYAFPQSLEQHLRLFHGLPCPHLTCPVCYTQLSSRAELKAHVRKHALSEACIHCFAHFPSRHQLSQHIDSAHAKRLACNSCRQSFEEADCLAQHQGRHRVLGEMVCKCGWSAGAEEADAELAVLMHMKACFTEEELQLFVDREQAEDEHDHILDTMLTLYHQTKDLNAAAPINECIDDMVLSVSAVMGSPAPIQVPASTEELELRCQLCGVQSAVLLSAEGVQAHLNLAHPRAKLCPLAACRKRFSSATRARIHAKRHLTLLENVPLKPQELQCPQCGKQLSSRGKLNWHLEHQHQVNTVEKPHSCQVCHRTFRFAANRDKHMSRHTPSSTAGSMEDGALLKCHHCECTFVKPKYLQRHEQRYHLPTEGSVSLFSCTQCGEGLESLVKLRRHVVYKHGPAADRQRFQCPECPVGCRTAVGLRVHSRVHSGERPYQCPTCSKSFKRTQALRWHEKRMHGNSEKSVTTERLFCCTECAVRQPTRSSITKHFLRTHRNLRRFVCGLCGERMCQNQELKQHMRSKHLSSAPSVPSTERRDQSHIYIYPGIERLLSTHPHSILISQIAEDEKRKTENLPDFPCVTSEPILGSDCETSSRVTAAVFSLAKPDNPIVIKPQSAQMSSESTIDAFDTENLTYVEANTSLLQLYNVSSTLPESKESFEACTMLAAAPDASSYESVICEGAAADKDTYIRILNPECVFEVAATTEEEDPSLCLTEVSDLCPEVSIVLPQTLPQMQTSACTSASFTTPRLSLACVHCDKTFADKARLERHAKVHSDVRSFVCGTCHKAFREKHNLVVHLRSHSGERPYRCVTCGVSLRYHQQLLEHQRRHAGERPFTCPQCPDRSFVRKKELQRHLATHQPNSTRFECPICGKMLARKDSLEVHIRSTHNTVENPFQCATCDKKFATEARLQQHRALHTGRKEHQCLLCGKSFALKSYLQGHLRIHARRNQYLQCTLCPRKFANHDTLQVHELTFHSKQVMQRLREFQQADILSGELSFDHLHGEETSDGSHVVFLKVLSDADLDILPT